MQEDPIFDLNLYAYVGNDPVNFIDPYGDFAITAGVLTYIGGKAIIIAAVKTATVATAAYLAYDAYRNRPRIPPVDYGREKKKYTEGNKPDPGKKPPLSPETYIPLAEAMRQMAEKQRDTGLFTDTGIAVGATIQIVYDILNFIVNQMKPCP